MRVNIAVMRGMTDKSKEIKTKYVSELNWHLGPWWPEEGHQEALKVL